MVPEQPQAVGSVLSHASHVTAFQSWKKLLRKVQEPRLPQMDCYRLLHLSVAAVLPVCLERAWWMGVAGVPGWVWEG